MSPTTSGDLAVTAVGTGARGRGVWHPSPALAFSLVAVMAGLSPGATGRSLDPRDGSDRPTATGGSP
ncbi:MAG: hypothetical protein ABEJ40_06940 [Haloarculaceae archaeon]